MRFALALVLLATACGTSIRATQINPSPHPMHARPPASVELFTSGPPQGRQYVDIAYLEAQQESDFSADEAPEFLAELRSRGAAMGCDAVVIGAPTNEVNSSLGARHPTSLKGLVATCIVFTDTPAMATK